MALLHSLIRVPSRAIAGTCAVLAAGSLASAQVVTEGLELGGPAGETTIGSVWSARSTQVATTGQVGGLRGSAVLGSLSFDPGFFDPNFGIGRASPDRRRGYRVGPFDLEFTYVRGALLLSDNVDGVAEPLGPETGWISEVALGMTARATLFERFSIELQGELLYLPFVNELGVGGFGGALGPDFRGRFGAQPLSNVAVAWDTEVSGWEVSASSAFGWYEYGLNEWVDGNLHFLTWDPVRFDGVDRAGRYEFQSLSRGDAYRYGAREPFEFETNDYLASRNDARTLSSVASVSRLVGILEGRMTGSAFSRLTWTERETEDGSRREHWYGMRAAYESLRENLRFRPFATYELSRQEGDRGWTERTRAGVLAPLTELTTLTASAGTVRRYGEGTEEVYDLGLRHILGPYTVHALTLSREVTEVYANDTVRYQISQVLTSRLTGTVAFERTDFDRLDGAPDVLREEIASATLAFRISDRTSLSASLTELRRSLDEAGSIGIEQWTILSAGLRRRFDTGLTVDLNYSYQDRQESDPNRSTTENLLIFSVRQDL